MTAAWPASLPGPMDIEVRMGSTLAVDSGRFGLRRRRRRMTSPWDTLTGRVVLDDVQRQALDTFFAIDLSYGAAWFTATWLPLAGYPNHQARFVRPPAFEAAGQGVWHCRFELEIRDAGFADAAGLPSPNHDPAVQSGPVSPFEGKAYRFYDDFSTFQGWTLEAGSAPTHDAAAGTLTVPAGTRISKPLNLDFSDYSAGKLVARMQVKSNGTGYFWGSSYPTMYGKFGVFIADDAGNGYGTLFDRSGYDNAYAVCARLDASAWSPLAQASRSINTMYISSLTIELALAEGDVFALSGYGDLPQPASTSDTAYTTALRVGVESFDRNGIVDWLEVEFS